VKNMAVVPTLFIYSTFFSAVPPGWAESPKRELLRTTAAGFIHSGSGLPFDVT